MGSSRQTQSQNSRRDPYAPAVPLLNQTAGGVSSYLSNPNSFAVYGGDRVAQMSDATRGGIDQLAGQAGANQSAGYLSRVLNGDYLNPGNPYTSQLVDSIRSSVMPSVNDTFSNAGMTGSTLHQGALMRGLSDAVAAPLFNSYQQERQNQMSAAQMLPGVESGAALNRIQAGQLGEGYDQRNIDAARQQFAETQMAPLMPYANASGIIGQIANAGGTSSGTSTSTSTPSLGSQILGGAMMGASVLSAPYTGGLGMMGGGGLTNFGALSNVLQGNPATYGASWAPRVLPASY